jgi:hypothetical protein
MFKKSIAEQRPFKLALIASIALLGAASAPGFAATATATATANIVTPINVSKSTDLSFGKFIVTTGGNVTINTAGARTSAGVTELTGSTSAATFAVTGEPSATYTINTTGTSANLTSGANTMALTIASDLTGAGITSGTASTGTLSAGGAQTIYIGGVLTVAAAQPAGAYTGSIALAVDYN